MGKACRIKTSQLRFPEQATRLFVDKHLLQTPDFIRKRHNLVLRPPYHRQTLLQFRQTLLQFSKRFLVFSLLHLAVCSPTCLLDLFLLHFAVARRPCLSIFCTAPSSDFCHAKSCLERDAIFSLSCWLRSLLKSCNCLLSFTFLSVQDVFYRRNQLLSFFLAARVQQVFDILQQVFLLRVQQVFGILTFLVLVLPSSRLEKPMNNQRNCDETRDCDDTQQNDRFKAHAYVPSSGFFRIFYVEFPSPSHDRACIMLAYCKQRLLYEGRSDAELSCTFWFTFG